MATLRDFSGNDQAEVNHISGQPTARIEVELAETSQHELQLKLRQQSWAEGMGWFTQKTVVINPEEVPDLIHQLEQAAVSVKLTRSQAHHRPTTITPEPVDEAKIIKFPGNRPVRKSEPEQAEPVANEQGKVLIFKPRRHFGK